MIKQTRILALILVSLMAGVSALAQPVFCPNNVDFENGNFTNWQLYTGSCCPINTSILSGPVSGRHTVVSGTAVDPFGFFPVVAPESGVYSLKLGNSQTGAQAERARYYVRVPNDLNNYSLILRYAVVLEDGGHSAIEQPRFEVKGYDSITNVALPCVQFNFVASSVLPGFNTSTVNANVKYKAWSTATINLSGFAGRTVALDFASGDCDQGGHFGYGYVDLNCGLFQISSTVCKGSTVSSLTAPPGFQFYEWYDSTFTTLVGSTRTISVPTPAITNKYYVIVKPYSGFGCVDTLLTRLAVSDLRMVINPDTIVCNNVAVQLRDSATASAPYLPLSYKWTPTTALSCSNCLNPIASPSKTTRYTLQVTDATGCVVSDSFTVTVKLYIASQPPNIIQCKGSTAKFLVVPGGIGPFAFQWYKNGMVIPGENRDSLLIPNIQDSDTADYKVVVWGQCDSIVSSPAKLSLYTAPKVIQQPQNLVQCLGSRVVLKTTSIANSSLTYQWFRRGILLPGATRDSLVINSFSANDSGLYFLKVQGPCDSVRTDTIRLSMHPPTVITIQPTNVSGCKGTRAVYRVSASGPGPLTYQWRKNTVAIAGETKDSLVINPIKSTDVGNYTVVVTSSCSSVTSAIARLDIPAVPAILTQPSGVLRCSKTKIVFRVTASSATSYQWLKNGIPITGANKDSLVFVSAAYSDTADYSVQVIGVCDTIESSKAKLSLYLLPIITQQPVGTIQCINTPVTLKMKASSSSPIQYQWWKNGKKLTGATKDSLFVSSLAPADSGNYFMVVKSACDSVISDTVYVGIRYIGIKAHPVSVINCLTKDMLFRVNAFSADSMRYQWKMNGVDLVNQTTDSLRITNAGYNDTATYTVGITTVCDTVVSLPAKLSIFTPTSIIVSPQNTVQCHYTTAVLRAKGTGTGTVLYQWYKNGVLLSGETKDSLMVSNISYADTGNRYTVLVKSFCDSVWSGNVQIGVFPVPDPGLPDSTLLCINVGYIESLGFVKYLWNTGATINRIPVPVDGTYTVAVTDYNNCTNKDTTYVKLKAQPSLDAGPDTVLCNELSLQLAATASNYDSVKWTSESSGVYSNRSSLVPIFTPNTGEEGVKNLVLSAYNGCGVTTDQLTVTLKRKTSAAFTPEDTVVCEGSRPVRLIPDNPGGLFTAMYLTHDSFIPQQKGLYITKYIISENGCTDSSTQLIRVVAVPSSSFGYSKGLLSIDSAVTFIPTSTNAQQYVWYFDNGDTSETDTVVYRYTKEGLYRVKLVSINEMCSDTLTEDILILGSNHIWIPNVFTPDGDGLNDIFKTVYINHRGGTLSIYNRWGQRVYISNDLTAGWDGTYAGQNCVSDVYVYVVDYLTNEGSVKQLKGNVTLLR